MVTDAFYVLTSVIIPVERSHSQTGRKLILLTEVTIGIFQAWDLYKFLKGQRASFFKEEETIKFPIQPNSQIVELKRVNGNLDMSDVDAVMYVVLTKAGKYVPYGELLGSVECIAL